MDNYTSGNLRHRIVVTRLGLYGGPSSPYGGFAPKAEAAGAAKEQTTRLGLHGGARQLYSDFSPKAEAAGAAKEQTTRLGLHGGARQLYSDFSPKAEAAGAGKGLVTRLGLYGGARGLYGDFTAKAESDAVLGGRRRHRFYLDDLEVDYEFGLDVQLDSSILKDLSIPLESPIKADAVAIKDITDPVDRELAMLMRGQVVKEHGKLQQSRLEQLQLLDMELYFMVLALIDEDF